MAPAATSSANNWPQARWWQGYGDVTLDALVDRALAEQPGLQVALARVRAAQAVVDAASAPSEPSVAANADLTGQRYGRNGLVPPSVAGSFRWSPSATATVGWEPDLFGRQRAAFESAVGHWRAAQAEAQAARVVLTGQLVQGWITLARQLDARAVAERVLQQRQALLALLRERIGAGLDSVLEQRIAEGQLALAAGEAQALDEAVARTRHALAELSAQPAAALASARPSLDALRAAPLPAELPADLLGRRADLLAQRWRVEAALREVDGARAQFHPNVNLMAFAGLSSLGIGRWLDAGSFTAGIGPALHLPLFDGGRLRAQLGARSAEADAAIEAYNAALLRALREVADELDSLRWLALQQASQDAAGRAARAAHTVAGQRHAAGLANRLSVLNAETAVLVQQRAAIDLLARNLAADAALQLALGGGFHADFIPTAAAR